MNADLCHGTEALLRIAVVIRKSASNSWSLRTLVAQRNSIIARAPFFWLVTLSGTLNQKEGKICTTGLPGHQPKKPKKAEDSPEPQDLAVDRQGGDELLRQPDRDHAEIQPVPCFPKEAEALCKEPDRDLHLLVPLSLRGIRRLSRLSHILAPYVPLYGWLSKLGAPFDYLGYPTKRDHNFANYPHATFQGIHIVDLFFPTGREPAKTRKQGNTTPPP